MEMLASSMLLRPRALVSNPGCTLKLPEEAAEVLMLGSKMSHHPRESDLIKSGLFKVPGDHTEQSWLTAMELRLSPDCPVSHLGA